MIENNNNNQHMPMMLINDSDEEDDSDDEQILAARGIWSIFQFSTHLSKHRETIDETNSILL